jgi:DNA polymerase-1
MDIEYAIDLLRGFPPKTPITPKYIVCNTPDLVDQAVRRFMKKPILDCDIETTGFNRFRDEILCLGMSYDPRLVFIFPHRISLETCIREGAHPDWFDRSPSMLPHLAEFFRRYEGKFCWHNGKFDISFLRSDDPGPNFPRARVDEDTMLMSYTLDEYRGIHDLEQVAGDLLGAPDYKYLLKPWAPRKRDSYCKVPKRVLYNYLAFDVSNTAQIRPILRRRIQDDPKLNKLYTRLLIPASETLYWVEHAGIPVSEFAVVRQQKRLEKEIARAETIVNVHAQRAGYKEYVNPASPLQVRHLLFDVLKLSVPKGMKRSTRKEVLAKLPQIPIVRAHRAFKKAQKAKTTYADTILRNIEPHSGRVHPTLLLHGTRTGRLAHKVVANIPRDKLIRGMYAHSIPLEYVTELHRNRWDTSSTGNNSDLPAVTSRARKGRIFIKADVDQAELRVLAAMSGDPELCAIYRSNTRKLHREVSNDIWGSPGTTEAKKGGEYKWGLEEYMRAKGLNFGIIYGRQALSIGQEFGVSEFEAQGYINAWKTKFPKAWAYIERCRGTPLRNETMVTPFGRKKRHWIVTRENVIGLQNEASNFPEQSIASDIVLEAANKISPILRARDCHIVFLVHDEILIDAPDDIHVIRWARKLVVEALEQAPKTWGITRVPFKADTSIGRRWGIYRKSPKAGFSWEQYLEDQAALRAASNVPDFPEAEDGVEEDDTEDDDAEEAA